MAQAFGVSTTFIDKELASFITAGRIHAKIDKGKIPMGLMDISQKIQLMELLKRIDQTRKIDNTNLLSRRAICF